MGLPDVEALAAMRRSYTLAGLGEDDLEPTWLAMLRRWLGDAQTLLEPNAMVLATADAAGRPSARTVLLKGLDERGLTFYTNYGSRKGRELEANPHAALVFPWHELQRQVVVAGRVERLADDESDMYFRGRPAGSQLGAAASPQSAVLRDRAELQDAFDALAARHPDGLSRPPGWGGLRVVPAEVEFWQGRPDRLHDRLRYRDAGAAWVVERLAP